MNYTPFQHGDRPVVAFGPRMPGWGSWDWLGQDLAEALAPWFETKVFDGAEVPECDAVIVVKHPLPEDLMLDVARTTPLVYFPVDCFGGAGEIDSCARWLRRCARVVVHAHSLTRYFSPYAPTEYLDHHVKFVPATRSAFKEGGFVLWVGVRSNLPYLVNWLNEQDRDWKLRILTNLENPAHVPTARELGLVRNRTVVIEHWTPAVHLRRVLDAKAALDVKGGDFRQVHKPPTKAFDFVASGLPLAMPSGASVDHLASWGFELASPEDEPRWFSRDYWRETQLFGAAVREILSRSRIALRLRRILAAVMSERHGVRSEQRMAV